MNIFVLSEDPVEAAQLLCDKHAAGKMVVESAQMLSTAHRMLDGVIEQRPSKSGKRRVKYWRMLDEREDVLYKAVHMNHPCTVWTRETEDNYLWHYRHFVALCDEYTYRYDKAHKTDTLLRKILFRAPANIPHKSLTPWARAMPEEYKDGSTTESYQNYYQSKQDRFKMVWSRRETPSWFNRRIV